MKIRVTVIARGLVQGVAFRHHTVHAAEERNVTGWVRNLPDGSVQGCFEGEEEDVRAQVEWCRRGPEMARVDELVVAEGKFTGEFAGFSIRHAGD
jgi:acylphosphatase